MGFNMKPKSPLTKKLVSALKHKPWAAAHKERPAHSGTAEAHNAEPAAPTKKYVSDAQRKAVHASKAEQSPTKLKKQQTSKPAKIKKQQTSKIGMTTKFMKDSKKSSEYLKKRASVLSEPKTENLQKVSKKKLGR